jgi:formylglycine-generating enzyme required for sulfatase activity
LYSPEADCPITSVTWYEAAQYCRWLSEQEGIPEHEMVYPSVKEIERCKEGLAPLKSPADYLKRQGYRLPTEAEWEYACRAGARSSRYYGSSVDLLPRYAWYLDNSPERTRPVGQKRPNDLGLFDMHGNVWTWCHDSPGGYQDGSVERPVRDVEDLLPVLDRTHRGLRGASFDYRAGGVRAAFRNQNPPGFRNLAAGLRVAKTCN